jgi:hypothetical protein
MRSMEKRGGRTYRRLPFRHSMDGGLGYRLDIRNCLWDRLRDGQLVPRCVRGRKLDLDNPMWRLVSMAWNVEWRRC